MFKPCRHTARVRGRRSSDASTPASPSLRARFARGISALDGRARGLLIATTVALVTLSILIFFFSAEGGDASSVRSDAIARALAPLFAPDIDTWDSLARKAFISDLRFFVRKAAHATEYAALGALWFAELHQLARALADDAARTAACASARTMRHALTMRHARTMRSVHTAACAFALTVVYACTDEFHQLFVGGRAGQAIDVLVDAAGGLVGIAFALACAALLAFRRSRRNV